MWRRVPSRARYGSIWIRGSLGSSHDLAAVVQQIRGAGYGSVGAVAVSVRTPVMVQTLITDRRTSAQIISHGPAIIGWGASPNGEAGPSLGAGPNGSA